MNTLICFPLLSIYALVFDMAGIPFWKLHISVNLQFPAPSFKSLKCKRMSDVNSTFSMTFHPPLVSIIVVVLFCCYACFICFVLVISFHCFWSQYMPFYWPQLKLISLKKELANQFPSASSKEKYYCKNCSCFIF